MELDERLYSRYKSVGMTAQAQFADGPAKNPVNGHFFVEPA